MPDPSLSRREQNKREKRGRIIAASRALFAHKGFDATTTQEIAEAAQIGIGTLFLYAKTKEDLLIQVFHDEMIDLIEQAYRAARNEAEFTDQVMAFFDTLVTYHELDLSLARALLRQVGWVQSEEQRGAVRALMAKLLRRLAMIVEAGKTAGRIDPATPLNGAAGAIFGCYQLRLNMLVNGYCDREQYARYLRRDLRLLLDGLGVDKG